MSTTSSVDDNNIFVPWWLVLLSAISAIIIGMLLFIRPAATLIILIQFLGIYWLVSGIFSLVSLIWDRSGWGWKLLNGILGIIAGALIVQNLLWSTLIVPVTMAFILGVVGVMMGIVQIISAFRGGGWAIGILGAFSILLGLVLIARPVIAALATPWVLGFLLVFGGIVALFGAFSLRRLEKESKAMSSGKPAEPVKMSSPGISPVAAGVGAVMVSNAVIQDEAVLVPEPVTQEVEPVILMGNVDPNDPAEMAKFKNTLEYVEGIGPVYAAKLKELGLVTCLDLLKAGASRKGRDEISVKSGVSDKLILEWVNHVDLYRVKGVGAEYADLLEAAGVDTVVELAMRNASNLFEKMNQVNEAKVLVRKLPTLVQVEDWISQAKTLPRAVSY